MTERQQALSSIVNTIGDYRLGEVERPTPDHVDRWASQFDEAVQLPLLRELDHVLKETYFSRAFISQFLEKLVTTEKLAGTDPSGFWRSANFLDIQQNGHSQEEMLQVFTGSLQARCGLRPEECGSDGGPYIYLDDVLFSGNRVSSDLSEWLAQDAPTNTTVHIVAIATHTLGEYLAPKYLRKTAAAAGKAMDLKVWRAVAFENRKAYRNSSEVLWPAVVPADQELQAYMAEEQKFPFEPRQPGGTLEHNMFSSEQGRQLLERELLLAGVRIRSLCQNPSRAMRPLGFSHFGLGFGSMIVTFRNCPNNCPLALWWGDPDAGASSPLSRWYPLLPRKTYNRDVDFDGFQF